MIRGVRYIWLYLVLGFGIGFGHTNGQTENFFNILRSFRSNKNYDDICNDVYDEYYSARYVMLLCYVDQKKYDENHEEIHKNPAYRRH